MVVVVAMGAVMQSVHIQLCGRRCRAFAGCPESIVLLRCRPAGCGRPARNPLRPERGSSHSATNTQKEAVSASARWLPLDVFSYCFKLPRISCDYTVHPRHPSMLKLIFWNYVFLRALQHFKLLFYSTRTHAHTDTQIIHIKQISAPQGHFCNALHNKRR